MPYSAASVANKFLELSFRDNKPVTPMKIQKLLYIAHGYSLVELSKPMLNEVFEAWQFGPVLSTLYHECKNYRSAPISKMLRDIDPITGKETSAAPPDDAEVIDIISFVWDQFKDVSATVLSDWTHDKNGPWYSVTKGGTEILRHQDVPNDLIKTYFESNLYGEEKAA